MFSGNETVQEYKSRFLCGNKMSKRIKTKSGVAIWDFWESVHTPIWDPEKSETIFEKSVC